MPEQTPELIPERALEPLTRRGFLRGAALTGGALAAGGLFACAPSSPGSASPGGASAPGDIAWDHEVDLVVAGSGTAVLAALVADHAGSSVMLLEKGAFLGGTTLLSGCVCWVPGNYVMAGLGYGPDVSDEEVLAYLKRADVSDGGTDELRMDYIKNAREVFRWMKESLGMEQGIFPATCDYYDVPGAMGLGRSLGFVDSVVDERNVGMDEPFAEVFLSRVEEAGIEALLNTEVTAVIQDETGRTIGVKALQGGKEIYVKGNKGVLLGCGGFEHNEEMRKQYLYGPLEGMASPSTNTGDAHKMGMRVGADLGNMSSIWGNPFYIIGDDPAQNPLADYGMYAGLPGAVYVNSKGKRFCNEAAGYDVVVNPMYNYSTKTYSFENIPAWMIFDANHVEHYSWPTFAEEKPEWVAEFASLEELAQACSIDPEGLLEEISHFNALCADGVDADFGRGAWLHDSIQTESFEPRPDLANCCLEAISTAPFYAVRIGPGAFGTNGGLKVSADAQVLDTFGKPIEGLYACGNSTSSIVGSIYPGPGGTVGPGFYQAFKAANHSLGLGLL
jgi:succinate dehydrogenase/fumarate reductase flavoprotein subunit